MKKFLPKLYQLLTLLALVSLSSPARALAACITTPIGCLPTDPGGLVSFIILRAIGLAGGIALLLLVFGGIRYITSKGSPDATKEAAEIMTAAVSGLLLIVLSVVILRILGRDILGLGSGVGFGL